MKTLLISIFLFCSAPLLPQSGVEVNIALGPLQIGDVVHANDREAHGSDCEFFLESDNSTPDSPMAVLYLLDSPDLSTSIRLNGKLVRLEYDSSHVWKQGRRPIQRAWRNGEIKVILVCTVSPGNQIEGKRIGTIEVIIGRQSKVFKIYGFCGC